ncbi:MAG TPA: COQ9 family protein [Rhizomicrobium sp.]|jgi:ubiquinone biosynthesis protein COQ9|nr:COQ9 family protein [Rhizomicrobium sp.]
MTAPAKPRRQRRQRAEAAEAKDAVLAAALVHVPFDGFTGTVLRRAAAEAGVARNGITRLFPEGPLSLVEAFSESADAEMGRLLAKAKLSNLKVRERIALAVKMRIAVLRPHKEAARRAAAFLTLPPHAALGIRLLYRTVDAIWRGIGDTSTDFNFYTKRAILAGVYSSTLLRWFSDSSEGEEITNAFLQRRIDEVMRFEKFKAQVRERARGWPGFSEIFNPPPRRPAGRSRAKAG